MNPHSCHLLFLSFLISLPFYLSRSSPPDYRTLKGPIRSPQCDRVGVVMLATGRQVSFPPFNGTNTGSWAEPFSMWEDPDAGLAPSTQVFPQVGNKPGFCNS